MLKIIAAASALAALIALPAAAIADASPSPAPTAHPRIKASPKPLRSAVNLCDHALLYTWPAEGGLPNRSNVPPATSGERFQIQAGPRHSLDGHGYYETTIQEPAGLGGGGYYWVSDRCFSIDR